LAQYEHLPIYKGAFDLLVYFEKIVRNFSRYNKYSHGTELRTLTRKILTLIVRANNSREKLPVLEELRQGSLLKRSVGQLHFPVTNLMHK
jgi:hypothetical protein